MSAQRKSTKLVPLGAAAVCLLAGLGLQWAHGSEQPCTGDFGGGEPGRLAGERIRPERDHLRSTGGVPQTFTLSQYGLKSA
jgi:hypothetical protein